MEIMPKMLTDLKNNLHGCPIQFTTDENGNEFQSVDEGVKDWENILNRMIFCFQEMNEDTCSMTNEYHDEYFKQLRKPRDGKPAGDWFPNEEIVDEHGKKQYRLIFGEVEPELKEKYQKRKREIEDYKEKMKNEGLGLFCKYFSDLWD
jgi:hypothetical protein